MSLVVPHPFLFRYSFAVRRADNRPSKSGPLLGLGEEHRLPDLDGLHETPRFAEIRMGWNPNGLGVSVVVAGKQTSPACFSAAPIESDGLQVWIDTRNTQSIHRASRFCHHFCALPRGGKRGREPVAVQVPIVRAREESPLARPDKIAVSADVRGDGYLLEMWLPAEVLHGFDPEANPRLGFYAVVRDMELGEQCLTVGREFPFAYDPSVWSTIELV